MQVTGRDDSEMYILKLRDVFFWQKIFTLRILVQQITLKRLEHVIKYQNN